MERSRKMNRLLPHDSDLRLLPSRLSASELDPNSQPNFTLRLRNPLLARIERCTSLPLLRQLHSLVLTSGLARQPFAHSRLLASAALPLHADLHYALRLFLDPLHQPPNLFSFNTVIRAFSRSNRPDLCVLFYIALLETALLPDGYTYPFLLKACAHGSMVREGLQLHGHVVKYGFCSHSVVGNSLVKMYSELGSLDGARKVFDEMPHRDEVAWATMIGGYLDSDRAEEALGLFCSRDWQRMSVDQVMMGIVLKACAKVKDLRIGQAIHAYIKEMNVDASVILCNSLMKMYTECGHMESARKVLDGMRKRDLCSWNILINGHAENGDLEECMKLLVEMREKGLFVEEGMVLSVVSACKELEIGVAIHGTIREAGIVSSLPVSNALICMYSRTGCIKLARQVFDEMVKRDAVTWNSMISAYMQFGSMKEAHNLFDQMPQRDNISWSTMILGYVRQDLPEVALEMYKDLVIDGHVEPDRITILSALAACADAGSLEEGRSIHLSIEQKQMPIDTSLGTALIDMYAKCGCLEKAIRVFEDLQQKDVIVWTSLISGLAVHGCGSKALLAFQQMQSQAEGSVKPNAITFLSVLSACVHSGLVKEGCMIYSSMLSDHGIEPSLQHNGCMVDLLARAGLLDEAAQFIASLDSSANVYSWGALLNASRLHGNTVLAEVAARKILELDPLHDGAHVLLSNIHAAAGRWNDSREGRRKMKEEGIQKEVGCSWIEVNGIRHEFTAGEGLVF